MAVHDFQGVDDHPYQAQVRRLWTLADMFHGTRVGGLNLPTQNMHPSIVSVYAQRSESCMSKPLSSRPSFVLLPGGAICELAVREEVLEVPSTDVLPVTLVVTTGNHHVKSTTGASGSTGRQAGQSITWRMWMVTPGE